MLIFLEISPYFSGVLGAITFYVLLRKPMKKLVSKGWNTQLSALLLLFLSVIGILIPVIGIVLMLENKISNVANNSEHIINSLKEELKKSEQYLGFDLYSKLDISQLSSIISEKFQNIAGGTFEMAISIFIMYFLLYYMLTNRRKLRENLYEYIPLKINSLKMRPHTPTFYCGRF